MIAKGYKQTEVGVIPEDWILFSIENMTPRGVNYGIVDGPFGSNLKTEHYKKSGIPIITSGYVTNGYFKADNYLYVDELKFKQEKRSAVKGGDIVMAKIGARCGASAILPLDHEIGILSGNALKITIDKTKFSTKLVWHFLQNIYLKGDLDGITSIGAQPAISMSNLKVYKIPLPPTLKEQEAIAKVLTDTDNLIQGLENVIAKKKAIKKGAMQQLLTPPNKGGKRLPGFSGEWVEKSLGEVARYKNGTAHEQCVVKTGDYVIVNSKFVSTEGRVKKYSKSILNPVKKDDILMVLSDVPNGKAIAKCFYVNVDNKYTLNQRICALTFELEFVDSRFLFLILNRNPYFLGFDDGAKQTNLRNEDVLKCPLNIPKSVLEQQKISQIIFDMTSEIEVLQAKKEKYIQLKKGLAQELLTGKTRLV